MISQPGHGNHGQRCMQEFGPDCDFSRHPTMFAILSVPFHHSCLQEAQRLLYVRSESSTLTPAMKLTNLPTHLLRAPERLHRRAGLHRRRCVVGPRLPGVPPVLDSLRQGAERRRMPAVIAPSSDFSLTVRTHPHSAFALMHVLSRGTSRAVRIPSKHLTVRIMPQHQAVAGLGQA